MKKINIIKKNEDFKKILDQGKFIKNKYYIIYYKDNIAYPQIMWITFITCLKLL